MYTVLDIVAFKSRPSAASSESVKCAVMERRCTSVVAHTRAAREAQGVRLVVGVRAQQTGEHPVRARAPTAARGRARGRARFRAASGRDQHGPHGRTPLGPARQLHAQRRHARRLQGIALPLNPC